MKIKNHNAEPAQSLRMKDRQTQPALNPKPSITERFNQKFYVPNKYLNPYGSPNSSFSNLVVTSLQRSDDRVYVSPENRIRRFDSQIEKTSKETKEQFKINIP